MPNRIYSTLPYDRPLALLTDFYQLTMANGFYLSGQKDTEAVFHLYFRSLPFQSGFAVACGLDYVIDFLTHFRFEESDLEYLSSIPGNDGCPILAKDFLEDLRRFEFQCDVEAVPEGTVVFANEPLLRIRGPIIQAQILETILLNIINFQTLIATKASRIHLAAHGDTILEFGLRRAQGFDGGLTASRAAYIGGCHATSNVLAGKIFGIPVRGTQAHSWVMTFPNELEAFREFAKVMPNNAIFLVDTYNTLEGVRHAVEIGKELRKEGHEMIGIRLDSGDLAYLSVEARKMLDAGGFKDAKIIASNELDETIINSIKQEGGRVDIWGVGTKLVTAFDQPALGGIYKLSAVRKPGGPWDYKIKISEQASKSSHPGILQVRRFSHDGENIGDAVYDEGADLSQGCTIVDPVDASRTKEMPKGTPGKDLLVPVFRKGKCVYQGPQDIHEIRQQTLQNLEGFHSGIKRMVNPHSYPVGIEKSLFEKKMSLLLKAKKIGK